MSACKNIRLCLDDDFESIYAIVNDAAQAYRGVIPADRWRKPYMLREELRHEIDARVVFYGFQRDGQLLGVMGKQDVADVTLIRHAYVRSAVRGQGIGSALLKDLRHATQRPLLVGTWAAATWAISFYERHGFALLSAEQKDALLQEYWAIPERQRETSVVLMGRTTTAL
jgi:GNAT superfamily N-acetyltransferase